MTEFELIRGFAALGRDRKVEIAKSLGLAVNDVATEEGVKRQFLAAKAANKLGDLERLLPKRP
jgi:hypothetical protein